MGIFKSFSDKKFKYGSFSTLMIIFVIAILVTVNLVVGQLKLSYDLTADKKYSISDRSKEILSGLQEEVTLYVLFRTGQENSYYKDLIDQYGNASSKINIVYKDPYLYPQFVESYAKDGESILQDSVIVESSKRHKVVHAKDMLTYDYDYNTFEQYLKSIDAEPQITNAIRYVTDENTSVIYTLTGHSEPPIDDAMKKLIDYANYEIKELDLLTKESVPKDADILFVTTPARDWTAEEAQKVKDFLEDDGRAIFFVDYTLTPVPNLQSVINSYGVNFSDLLVVEGSTSNYLMSNPTNLVPTLQKHEINNAIISKGYMVFAPISRAIERTDIKKNSVTIDSLLKTSNQAYGKKSENSKSVNKEAGDASGPFDIALAITDSYYTSEQHTTKMVVVGTSYILDEAANSYVKGTNGDFVVNAINWLQDKNDNIYIMPKTSSYTQLVMSQSQAFTIMFIVVIALPLAIFITGLVIWLRRRNS